MHDSAHGDTPVTGERKGEGMQHGWEEDFLRQAERKMAGNGWREDDTGKAFRLPLLRSYRRRIGQLQSGWRVVALDDLSDKVCAMKTTTDHSERERRGRHMAS